MYKLHYKEIQFPDKPTCHGRSYLSEEIIWSYDGKYRYCSYCGSIHPEDLIDVLNNGAILGGSDWKYSWPHKFYIYNSAVHLRGSGKWYNEHLLDDGYSEAAFKQVCDILLKYSSIQFLIEDNKLMYKAPYYGYQKSTI